MPNVTPRLVPFVYDSVQDVGGLLSRSGTTLSASGNAATAPAAYLTNPALGFKWRSETGWRIVSGFNNAIPFTEGTSGEATGAIVAGIYVTGAALATAITTAMNNAATDNTYLCTYDSGTGKFTIARATGSDTFGMLWKTHTSWGTDTITSRFGPCGPDLGFTDTADDTGALSYTADDASYQSRHYLRLDLGAQMDFRCWSLLSHNLSAAAEVRRLAQNNGTANSNWWTPAYNSTTWDSGVASPMEHWETSVQTYQYVQIQLDDHTNDDGYTEVGVWLLGDYFEPSRGFKQGHEESAVDASSLVFAIDGAAFQDKRSEPRTFNCSFHRLTRANRDTMLAMEATQGAGAHWLLARDPQNYPGTESLYGTIAGRLKYAHRPGDGATFDRYDVGLAFRQSLP